MQLKVLVPTEQRQVVIYFKRKEIDEKTGSRWDSNQGPQGSQIYPLSKYHFPYFNRFISSLILIFLGLVEQF